MFCTSVRVHVFSSENGFFVQVRVFCVSMIEYFGCQLRCFFYVIESVFCMSVPLCLCVS